MGLYADQVLPRVTEWLLDQPAIERLRAEATRTLSGDIVEIGFGSGLNLPVLPDAVHSVHAVDPDRVGRRLAAERIAESKTDVVFTGLDGQRIPLEDHSMEGALSTFTLCSIPDVDRALAELRRVLVPGGRFCFLEHGRAPVERLARWQRRLNKVYSPIAGGCRLDLQVAEVIRAAGFEIIELDESTLGKKPGLTNNIVRGIALAP